MNPLNILIVDDLPQNLIALENLLESPDLNIVKAFSGNEALAKTFDYEFAVVLLDVQMPGMNGFEMAEIMRSSKRTENIPIIFVTANYKERRHVFHGYEAGAVDYLFKPIEPAVLKSKVGVFIQLHRQKLALEKKTRELDEKLVELEELQQELEEKNQRLKYLSTTDELTGVLNRRSFNQILEDELMRAVRTREPLTILMMDIDHFKLYNDTYGHCDGDICIKRVALAIAGVVNRYTDSVCRYGGEEFAAILPNTDRKGAEHIARNMLSAVRALNIRHEVSGTAPVVSISLGGYCAVPASLEAMDDTVRRFVNAADTALYNIKERGRDAFEIRGESLEEEGMAAEETA